MSFYKFTYLSAAKSKQLKFINDMAKVNIKSEIITAFGGIFFFLDKFLL